MPRDATATRSAILGAALELLREGGLTGFSIAGVASRAAVTKGLVVYHYGSRSRLLGLCASRLAGERADRLAAARGGRTGTGGIDAAWAELVRQQEDGTARAWFSLAAGGVLVAPERQADEDVVSQAARALLDGCAAALVAGAEQTALREAYDALSLALLGLDEDA